MTSCVLVTSNDQRKSILEAPNPLCDDLLSVAKLFNQDTSCKLIINAIKVCIEFGVYCSFMIFNTNQMVAQGTKTYQIMTNLLVSHRIYIP